MSTNQRHTPRSEAGFIDAEAVRNMLIFYAVVIVLGSIGLWELVKFLWRHIAWGWL